MHKKNMYKAIVAFAVALAFIAPTSAVFADNGTTQFDTTSITTDGNAVLASPVHNLDTGLNYATIQAAIDAVQTLNGHTIFVDNGVYLENVDVTKQLNLIGESRENVIVDGSGTGNVFYIGASVTNVDISTFSITNGQYCIKAEGTSDLHITNCDVYNGTYSSLQTMGIWIVQSSNTVITNCDLYNNDNMGIWIFQSSNTVMTDCNAYDNEVYGIYTQLSTGCVITGCDAYNNQKGISSGSTGCVITDCEVYNNFEGIMIGFASNNVLSGNDIHDNGNGGNFVVLGMMLFMFDHDIDPTNTINGKPMYYIVGETGLVFDGSTICGYIGLIGCTNIIVKDLNLNGVMMAFTTYSTISNVESYYGGNGILLFGSSYNNITNCDIHTNGHGIYLWDSSYNNITNCDIHNNVYGHGIYMMTMVGVTTDNIITNCDIYDHPSDSIKISKGAHTITYCNLYNNGQNGIYLGSSGNLVHHNNFVNNGGNHDGGTNQWDDGSEGNYWDDYEEKYPEAIKLNGIWDTPYEIPSNGQDNYPLTILLDEIPPLITDVVLTTSDPLDTNPLYGWENVSCTVIDNVAVDEVKLVVTDPNAVTTEYPMTKSGDTYYYETTFTIEGCYDYHIWANDTSNNVATSSTEQFEIPANEDVNLDGWIHFMDLVAIVIMYGDEGSNGWVREDVDNDGVAHFMDLVAIVIRYDEHWDQC